MECKIVGQFVQHLEVILQPGEEFFAQKGSIVYLEAGIEKELKFNGSGFKKILGAKLSGESLFILRLFNITNMPRKMVIGSRFGLLPIILNGDNMICKRGSYVGSDYRVSVTTKLSLSGLTGGMGLLLQKIQGHSTIYLDTMGEPIVLNLRPGEMIELDENHIIALLNIAENQMHSKWSVNNLFGGEGLSMMQIVGPGVIFLSPGRNPMIEI